MVAVCPVIFIQTLFLISGVLGRRIRTSCPAPFGLRCDNGDCIRKPNWCDGSYHCSDTSDEMYCSRYGNRNSQACKDDIHFTCVSNGMCIPIEGYCDGYSSCPDMSDEKGCSCEVLRERKDRIEYEASLGQYRTQQKCWILEVKDDQEITITIETNLYDRSCHLGNVTLYYDQLFPDKYDDVDLEEVLCPPKSLRFITAESDVKIHYSSNWYIQENRKDFFNFSYIKIDRECKNPQSFKCNEYICILPEKRCDGVKDCENGIDERDCDFASFSASYLKNNRKNVTMWMKKTHDADWGWKENTHRAVAALYLTNPESFHTFSYEDNLIAKQLELEVSTHLLRSKYEKLSPTELAAYINALLVICHNPRNFYGFDLILKLKEEIEKIPGYSTPFPYLTLCNAGETFSPDTVDNLQQILEKSSDHGFVLEIQALTIMTLSCISRNNQYEYLKQNITEFLNKMKQEQKEDGSFGNEYTTALVLQALIANGQANDKDWKFKSSIEFLAKKQKNDGSFGDILTTYLIMPVLNAKSLIDIAKVNCTESMKRPKEGNVVSDIKNRLGNKIPAKYSIVIGDDKDQVLPILLRTPVNTTVLELMTLAADVDPKYKFKTHKVKATTYVYEIWGIPNDPEKNKFWFLYRHLGNETVPTSKQSPDEVRVIENDHIVMWYKTLIM